MTKQDYIKIAAVLNANEADLALVLDFADMLEEDNERFDRARFIRASSDMLVEAQAANARMLKRVRDEA